MDEASSVLRSVGLTVGTPDPGSSLLPVSGTASVVAAALGTPLETVQAPGESARAVVNTASPQIPASLAGVVTGVVGLDGLFSEHSMLREAHPPTTESPESASPAAPSAPAGAQSNTEVSSAASPQACPAAQGAAFAGSYTSTQMASVFGLDQLFAQGRTGIGQSIVVVEFENYLPSDFASFESCYGLSNPIRNVLVDGGADGAPQGVGEAALDTELAAVNAPSASLVVYEAPNGNDAQAFDLYNRIADDDSSQVVTTSWGNCEADIAPGDLQTENGIFQRMALQGQTVIAASGDSGSEDCDNPGIGDTDTTLAVDDPGAQPDVVSAGGTSLPSPSASAQSVWNDCLVSGANVSGCAFGITGAGGGGYSLEWPAPPGQPSASGETKPCGLSACRAVPDFSYPSDPSAGSVAAFYAGSWSAFGGTSVAAPTNAGLFADTNQGCSDPLGQRRSGALRGAAGEHRHLHRHHGRQRRSQRHQRRPFPRRPASTPPAAWARPSTRTSPSPCRGRTGVPRWREWAPTRVRSAGAGPSRFPGEASATPPRSPSGPWAPATSSLSPRPPSRCSRPTPRPPRASTSRWRTPRVSPCRTAPTATASAETSTVARDTGSWPPTAASSTSVTPASGGARAASG